MRVAASHFMPMYLIALTREGRKGRLWGEVPKDGNQLWTAKGSEDSSAYVSGHQVILSIFVKVRRFILLNSFSNWYATFCYQNILYRCPVILLHRSIIIRGYPGIKNGYFLDFYFFL